MKGRGKFRGGKVLNWHNECVVRDCCARNNGAVKFDSSRFSSWLISFQWSSKQNWFWGLIEQMGYISVWLLWQFHVWELWFHFQFCLIFICPSQNSESDLFVLFTSVPMIYIWMQLLTFFLGFYVAFRNKLKNLWTIKRQIKSLHLFQCYIIFFLCMRTFALKSPLKIYFSSFNKNVWRMVTTD